MTLNFKELGLNKSMLRIIEESGFKEPSEIQEKVIPLALAGKDVIGGSATGSGKTLAFGAPIIEKIHPGNGIQALILTPTRELSEQVSKTLKIFAKYYSLNVLPIYGGVSLGPQIQDLEEAEIVVGTPGRILDHISRRTINLSRVKFLVLDEADRMLDMGFLPDVTEIIENCPKERQTLLFSATISPDIVRISKNYMNKAIEISVESYVDSSKLEQCFYEISSSEKFSLLVYLLKEENSKLVMVFTNTKRNADFIGKNLRRYDLDAVALHGDLSQNQRTRVIEEFHKSNKLILVCTDVAARGLDIKNVSHIYNYDCPKTSTEYIHRVGRTARAGKEGKAITLLCQRDFENFRRVLMDDALKIKRLPLPEFKKIFVNMAPFHERGNRYSGRSRMGDNRNRGERRGSRFGGGERTGGREGRFGGRDSSRSFGHSSSRSTGHSGYSRSPRRSSGR